MERFWVVGQDRMDENKFEEMIGELSSHWLEML